MTTYSTISDATASVGEPVSQALVRALRDNPLAMFEGATGAPRLQTDAIAGDAVTRDKIADAALNKHYMTSTDSPQACTGTLTSYLGNTISVQSGQSIRAAAILTFSNNDASRAAADCNATLTIGSDVSSTYDIQLISEYDGTDYDNSFATLAFNHNFTATSNGNLNVTLKVSSSDTDVYAQNAVLIVLIEGTA